MERITATPIPQLPYAADLPARIRKLREARDWSLSVLARRASISRSHLHQVEMGESSPTYAVVVKLCYALDVRPAALTDGLYEIDRDVERLRGVVAEAG